MSGSKRGDRSSLCHRHKLCIRRAAHRRYNSFPLKCFLPHLCSALPFLLSALSSVGSFLLWFSLFVFLIHVVFLSCRCNKWPHGSAFLLRFAFHPCLYWNDDDGSCFIWISCMEHFSYLASFCMSFSHFSSLSWSLYRIISRWHSLPSVCGCVLCLFCSVCVDHLVQAGPGVQISLFHLCDLFPDSKSFVTSVISASFSFSFLVFLGFKLCVQGHIATFHSLCMFYSFVLFCAVIWSMLLWPSQTINTLISNLSLFRLLHASPASGSSSSACPPPLLTPLSSSFSSSSSETPSSPVLDPSSSSSSPSLSSTAPLPPAPVAHPPPHPPAITLRATIPMRAGGKKHKRSEEEGLGEDDDDEKLTRNRGRTSSSLSSSSEQQQQPQFDHSSSLRFEAVSDLFLSSQRQQQTQSGPSLLSLFLSRSFFAFCVYIAIQVFWSFVFVVSEIMGRKEKWSEERRTWCGLQTQEARWWCYIAEIDEQRDWKRIGRRKIKGGLHFLLLFLFALPFSLAFSVSVSFLFSFWFCLTGHFSRWTWRAYEWQWHCEFICWHIFIMLVFLNDLCPGSRIHCWSLGIFIQCLINYGLIFGLCNLSFISFFIFHLHFSFYLWIMEEYAIRFLVCIYGRRIWIHSFWGRVRNRVWKARREGRRTAEIKEDRRSEIEREKQSKGPRRDRENVFLLATFFASSV